MAFSLKKQPSNGDQAQTAPATPQLVRSRFQEMLDDMNAAFKHLDHAANLASKLVHDFENGLRYIDRMRVDLTHSIEEAGGKAQETNIEQEIAAYIPQKHRAPEADATE